MEPEVDYNEEATTRAESPSPERQTRKRGRSRSPDDASKKAADTAPKDFFAAERNDAEMAGGGGNAAGRTGGVYIPPHKLRAMQKNLSDRSSAQFQRMSWDALRKSINGLINKVTVANITHIVPELFQENLIRGRGLLCRSILKAQMTSPNFTHVYAALVAIINTKMPEVGELLLKRIIMQFRRSYKRNDKLVSIACTKFIAHLVNQQVAHELLALQLVYLLLENPTDDSVEVAVDFIKESGKILSELSPQGIHGVFERFRGILHEGSIDKRVQYIIEGLFAVRKNGWADYPTVLPELDLVELDDQITHELSLDENHDIQTGLNIFHFDATFEDNEKQYAEIRKDILGDDQQEQDGGAGGDAMDADQMEAGGGGDGGAGSTLDEQKMQIDDMSETDKMNLRRTIYLTIMSSLDFEECAHKLMKMKIPQGQERELCNMIVECCSQERTYIKFYGLLGERFCFIAKAYQEAFDECFATYYATIHRYETNRIRNVAKFFSHLLYSDALDWSVFEYIRLTEDDTTSSSRIFIKNLLIELSHLMGLQALKTRFEDPVMLATSFTGLFPKDNPKNTRFAINVLTNIGLGALSAGLREHLKNAPKNIMQQKIDIDVESDSGSSSSSDSSDSSDSDSDSDSSSSDSSSSGGASSDDEKRKSKKAAPSKSKDAAPGDRDRNGGSKDHRAADNGDAKRSGRDNERKEPPASRDRERDDRRDRDHRGGGREDSGKSNGKSRDRSRDRSSGRSRPSSRREEEGAARRSSRSPGRSSRKSDSSKKPESSSRSDKPTTRERSESPYTKRRRMTESSR